MNKYWVLLVISEKKLNRNFYVWTQTETETMFQLLKRIWALEKLVNRDLVQKPQ